MRRKECAAPCVRQRFEWGQRIFGPALTAPEPAHHQVGLGTEYKKSEQRDWSASVVSNLRIVVFEASFVALETSQRWSSRRQWSPHWQWSHCRSLWPTPDDKSARCCPCRDSRRRDSFSPDRRTKERGRSRGPRVPTANRWFVGPLRHLSQFASDHR